MAQKDISASNFERKIIVWIPRLIRSDFRWLGHILLHGLRFAWRHKTGPVDSRPEESQLPTGPFIEKRGSQAGDLLLWVPRWIDSILIDDLTGRYGYSHNSIDTGEVDMPTGKPIMIEVTLGQTVERKFLDEYRERPFARIPVSRIGVDGNAFVNCVKSKLGESYDAIETLTFGEIDDPAKQMCSSLASDCLPESVRREIARVRRSGLLGHAAVSLHSSSIAHQTKLFVSPNGFAQYFGAPRGEKIQRPDVLVEPHRMVTSNAALVRHHASRAILFFASVSSITAALVIWMAFSKSKTR